MVAEAISIVGKSNSGKTTLIEKLVPELERRGVRVGTIKHDVHGFEIDYPGKDTYRHYAAGASSVLIASPVKMALVKRLSASIPLDELIARFQDDVDLVITEGYKSGDKPKIEVFRKEAHQQLLCGPEDRLVAVVSNDEVDADCRRFGLDEIEELADFIIQNYVHPG